MVAYANPGSQYNQYKQQSAMTASPGELTLMLYDGCIKYLKLFKMYVQEKDLAKANDSSKKAQAIIDELIRTLDLNYEISDGLLRLYDYIYRRMIDANMKKNLETADECISMLQEIRDTWQQAIRLNRQKVMGLSQE